MAILKSSLVELKKLLEDEFDWKDDPAAEKIYMIELGNQRVRGGAAKRYFSKVGINHTSIDLNGKDGALPLDLCSEIKIPKADIVTNFGTTEHVSDQFSCWKNVHNMCKTGGLIFNLVPLAGKWSGHCDYYYTVDFFDRLAELNSYTVIKNEIFNSVHYRGKREMVLCVLRKINDNVFAGIDDSLLVYIAGNERRRLSRSRAKRTKNKNGSSI